jgi:hypothetical protein
MRNYVWLVWDGESHVAYVCATEITANEKQRELNTERYGKRAVRESQVWIERRKVY